MTSNLPCCKLCKALRIQFNHYLFVEVMMSKFRMCLIVPLLLLALSILYDNTVLAQEPIPPSDMVITEHSRLEWVTEDNNKSAKQVLVTYVEATQNAVVEIPKMDNTLDSDQAVIGSVTVTMWRGLSYYRYDPWNYMAKTGARTQTSECVNAVRVTPKHKYSGPSGTFWRNGSEKSDWDLCKNDTGEQWINPYNLYAIGTTHTAVGDKHKVEINGNTYEWYGEGPSARPGY